MTFLYKGDARRGRVWAEHFARELPHLPFRTWPEVGDASQVRFLAAWQPPERIEQAFPNLEILFSTGAGVDQFDLLALPAELRVVRMVDQARNAIVYLTYSDRVIDGSPKNSVTAVAVPRTTPIPVKK